MKIMRSHGVFLDVDVRETPVRARDVMFLIYRGRRAAKTKFGELRVSQGGVVWRGRRDKLGRKLGWARLADLFDQMGRRSERRRKGARKTVSRRVRT